MIKSYDQFIENYLNHGTIETGTYVKKVTKRLNDRQLKTAYNHYVKNCERRRKDKNLEPSKDSILSKAIRVRDNNSCRLLKILSIEELLEWQNNQNGLGRIIDAAHVFGKGAYPWMRYLQDNIVCLNRYSHNQLDTHRSPINGKLITKEEVANWWIRIIGEENYKVLKEISYR